jgi:hypothetical protein
MIEAAEFFKRQLKHHQQRTDLETDSKPQRDQTNTSSNSELQIVSRCSSVAQPKTQDLSVLKSEGDKIFKKRLMPDYKTQDSSESSLGLQEHDNEPQCQKNQLNSQKKCRTEWSREKVKYDNMKFDIMQEQ